MVAFCFRDMAVPFYVRPLVAIHGLQPCQALLLRSKRAWYL